MESTQSISQAKVLKSVVEFQIKQPCINMRMFFSTTLNSWFNKESANECQYKHNQLQIGQKFSF